MLPGNASSLASLWSWKTQFREEREQDNFARATSAVLPPRLRGFRGIRMDHLEAPGKGLNPLRPRHRAGPAAQGLHPPLQAGWSTGHARPFAAAEFSGRVRRCCRVRYLTPGRAFAPYGILTDRYPISNRDSHPPLAAHHSRSLRRGAFRETATTSGPLSQQKFGGNATECQRGNCAHLNNILH